MNIVLFDSLNEKENFLDTDSVQGRHILNILHKNTGDSFKAGIWGKSTGECTIRGISGGKICFDYMKKKDAGKKLPVVLLISEIRPICMRRVMRFVGECGIEAVILTQTELGDKNYLCSDFYTKGEYMKLLKDGAEISSDAARPDVYFADSVKSGIAIAEKMNIRNRILLDDVLSDEKLFKKDDNLTVIAVGGERGFTSSEKDRFISSGFIPYNIGRRILRAEECGIVCLYPWL